jgi:hypothetical protein
MSDYRDIFFQLLRRLVPVGLVIGLAVYLSIGAHAGVNSVARLLGAIVCLRSPAPDS